MKCALTRARGREGYIVAQQQRAPPHHLIPSQCFSFRCGGRRGWREGEYKSASKLLHAPDRPTDQTEWTAATTKQSGRRRRRSSSQTPGEEENVRGGGALNANLLRCLWIFGYLVGERKTMKDLCVTASGGGGGGSGGGGGGDVK